MGKHVIDRSNLTVFFVSGQEDLPQFLAAYAIEVVASLPCYTAENVDAQRGQGVFEQSIQALKILNALGYGRDGGELELNLVYNPLGPSLPPPQVKLEQDYKEQLQTKFGIIFNRLYTITNMPINRFRDDLSRRGLLDGYLQTLEANFNAAAVPQVMCRSLISVGWDGRLYDCDFNQMLELPLRARAANSKQRLPVAHLPSPDGNGAPKNGYPLTLADFDAQALAARMICTGAHCLGCTAGAGSSCGGAIV